MFEWLLKLDVIRGPHSTGVARIPLVGDPQLVKCVGTTWDMMNQKSGELYNRKDGHKDLLGEYKVLMGHNRWATIGAVNEANAHPFHTGSIIGAHNGTLTAMANWRLDDERDYQTDSECIFHNFDKNGLEVTMDKLDGAWAFTWYDLKENTFNLLRNEERPCYFCFSENGKTMYYASEDWMLYTALEKANVVMAGDDNGVYMTSEDTHYKIEMDKVSGGTGIIGGVTKTIRKGRQYPKYTSSVTSNINWSKTVNSSNTSFGRGDVAPPPSLLDFKGMVGKFEEFFVASYKTDEQGKDYVAGWFINHEKIEARIYCPKDGELYKQLDDCSIQTFYGKVKKIGRDRGGVYTTMDMRTIKPVTWGTKAAKELDAGDDIPWDDFLAARQEPEQYAKEVIIGYDGSPCTKEEFEFDTNRGCAWCGVMPETKESQDITWIDKKVFLCDNCSSDQEIVAYTKQAL